MGFEEWLKTEYGASWPLHDNRFMKNAYRAGLLHAAEQDDEESKIGLHTDTRITYKTSAAIHRKAAEET